MMAPIFPHISEELWHRLGHEQSVHLQGWPQGDPEKAREDEINSRRPDQRQGARQAGRVARRRPSTLETQALALDNIQQVDRRQADSQSHRRAGQVGQHRRRLIVG